MHGRDARDTSEGRNPPRGPSKRIASAEADPTKNCSSCDIANESWWMKNASLFNDWPASTRANNAGYRRHGRAARATVKKGPACVHAGLTEVAWDWGVIRVLRGWLSLRSWGPRRI